MGHAKFGFADEGRGPISPRTRGRTLKHLILLLIHSYSSSRPPRPTERARKWHGTFYPFYQPCSTPPSPFPQRERASQRARHMVVAAARAAYSRRRAFASELSALNYSTPRSPALFMPAKNGGPWNGTRTWPPILPFSQSLSCSWQFELCECHTICNKRETTDHSD